MTADLAAGGVEGLAADEDSAAHGGPLTDQRLDQLALAVARDPRDAHDLARADRQAQSVDGAPPGVVVDLELANDQARYSDLDRPAGLSRARLRDLARADHHLGQRGGRQIGGSS